MIPAFAWMTLDPNIIYGVASIREVLGPGGVGTAILPPLARELVWHHTSPSAG
jgi:hypothetical protein